MVQCLHLYQKHMLRDELQHAKERHEARDRFVTGWKMKSGKNAS